MSQKANAVKCAQQSEVQPHQVGQEAFKTILSEDVVETVPGVPTFRQATRPISTGRNPASTSRSNRDGAAWTGIPQRERRSAKQQ